MIKPSILQLDPTHFLKHYWQKRPLLVRGAFPGFCDPVTKDELAGLSCEQDVESRLVMERGGAKPWQVFLGPQRAAGLRRLPRSHWSLLVQGVDRFIPGVARLMESFRFIPDWRVEDVMVSFAPRGGTVGPHVDSYDVFLLQGRGRRRWRLDPNASGALRPGLDLRILKHFHTTQDWILEPGDMLYLPPGLAHYGVALEECLTYSIGFRAPSAMDLLAAALERLAQTGGAEMRYQDPGLGLSRTPGEIPRAALKKMRRLLGDALKGLAVSEFDGIVGELLTSPKGSMLPEERRISAATLRAQMLEGMELVRAPGTRMGFSRRGGEVDLFVDGRRFPLNRRLSFAASLLTGSRRLPARVVAPHLGNHGFVQLLAALTSAGAFRLEW